MHSRTNIDAVGKRVSGWQCRANIRQHLDRESGGVASESERERERESESESESESVCV